MSKSIQKHIVITPLFFVLSLLFIFVTPASATKFDLIPPSGALQVGQNLIFTIRVNTEGASLSSIGVGLTYNTSILKYVTATAGATINKIAVDLTTYGAGKMAIASNSAGYTGSNIFATVTFNILQQAPGTAELITLWVPNVPGGGASCIPATFSKASILPSYFRPGDQVTVKCNYGKRLDCLSVTGAGLTNCRYSRYEGTDNIFTCIAGANAGFYNDAACVLKTGTADNCCAATNSVGNMNVIGTEVHYDQDIVLPFATHTLSARVFSVISKGKGIRVSIICNSATCTTGKAINAEIASITFPVSIDFVTRSLSVPLVGSGDDRHYLLRLSVDKGSEGYFDSVSLKNSAGKELVENGDFSKTTQSTISTKQPNLWSEGDNKVGYYYGSVANEQASNDPPGAGGNQNNTPGDNAAVSLNLKIKLQGVTKKPTKADPISVQVRLAGSSVATTPAASLTKSVQFTVNDAGEWSGKADFAGIPTGGGYKVYIKAPKHIQKKICERAPTESKGGVYHCGEGTISLQAGDNILDFSKIFQMAGDLPEAGGTQNGVIDAYDTTFIRTNLGSSDAAKVAIGDLNYDAIIDTQDYSMIVQSLSIKFDEE